MFEFLKIRSKTRRELFVNSESLETRVAVLENGKLEEFQVEHPTEQRLVGSIFKGVIQNLEHDLQAAFVDIGMKKNAFLHYWDMIPDGSALDVDIDGSENGESQERSRGGRRRNNGKSSRRRRYDNDDISKRFPAGSEIIVQVTKGAIGSKGPRVTANLSMPGRYLVMVPGVQMKGVSRKIGDADERQRLKKLLARLPLPENTGLIVRTAAIGSRSRSLARDLRGLAVTWANLQDAIKNKPAPCCVYQEPDLVERIVRDWLTEDVDRITVDAEEEFNRLKEMAAVVSRRARSRMHLYKGELPIFDHYDIERQIDEAFRRKVNLPSGGYIVFDETEALIAIDVNTGRHKGEGSQEDAILNVNMEAVEEVARQLRLRNIGGLVVIDLIDMRSRKHQNTVFRAMKAALQRDRARTNVLPISELGILEMTRQRVEESLLSSMFVDCPYCKGRGNVRSPLGMSVDVQRQISAVCRKRAKSDQPLELQITIHPNVLERLKKEDEQFLVDLESRFDGKLTFRADPSKHVEYFSIKNAVTDQVIYSSSER